CSTSPQVDSEMLRWEMLSPSCADTSRKNLTTLSKLSSGSPLPINTMLVTYLSPPPSAFTASTCPSISPDDRLRINPSRVLAQNLQPKRHPTCVDTQRVLPYLYFISTPSMILPSNRRYKNFSVPSNSETFFSMIST